MGSERPRIPHGSGSFSTWRLLGLGPRLRVQGLGLGDLFYPKSVTDVTSYS